ncbi:MAG: DUF4271 domain-containing protein [Parabacteroides merdae]
MMSSSPCCYSCLLSFPLCSGRIPTVCEDAERCFSREGKAELFDDVIGKSIFFFRNFMTFQVLFLSSIALIAVGRIYGFVNYAEWQAVLSAIGTVFCVLFLFYQFKQCCYYLLGNVFSDPDRISY